MRYRLAGVSGTVLAVVFAVWVANTHVVQTAVTSTVPLVSRLDPKVLPTDDFSTAVTTTTVVVVLTLVPLYKPRPRRILNLIYHTQRRVLIAGLTLAAIGYFDYTYRLPRATLIVTVGTLLLVLPAWFLTIRRAPSSGPDRVVIVGDRPDEIALIVDTIAVPILGYVAPGNRYSNAGSAPNRAAVADGSGVAEQSGLDDLECLGGLSRLDDILLQYNVDTAVFAFEETDRQEFFGALATCHDNGVAAKIYRENADRVLVDADPGTDIVDIAVEPWDWQDRAVKRVFDIGFSVCGLVVLSPLMAAIAVAIKLEDGGPVVYRQERTAEMGETFSVYKFRSMEPESEAVAPGEDESRITRVGRLLRATHLDEIPQLWSVCLGKMSVVGPRAAWTEEENLLEREVGDWRQRWFVKPGLTGLAQVNDVSSEDPEAKLRYDIEYIRRQSFRYDIAILIRQLWAVVMDLIDLVAEQR